MSSKFLPSSIHILPAVLIAGSSEKLMNATSSQISKENAPSSAPSIVSPIRKTLGNSSLVWLYTTSMYIFLYHVYIATTPKVKTRFYIWTQYTPVIPLMIFFKNPCTSASGAWVLEGVFQYKTHDLFYLVVSTVWSIFVKFGSSPQVGVNIGRLFETIT